MTMLRTTICSILAASCLALPASSQRKAVAVFVLAGQSNMEGKAQNKLLEHQATAAATRDTFAPFRRGDAWIERDDVFIKFLSRHGKLTVGYGSPGRTGCELAFGTLVGDRIDAPVLLIKTAWGGHSLRKNFRPPSAGLPPEETLQQELEQAIKRTRQRNEKNKRDDPLPTMADIRAAYGKSYRMMLEEVRTTLEQCGKLFPELRGRKHELTGFVWFQGWNDQYGGAELEYERNMRHLITDVRRDLEAPELPFVIGVMGQNMDKPAKGAMKTIQMAQLAMAEVPSFRDNVRAVPTDVLVDLAAARLYPEWKERREEWDRTGSDHPYHYLGSAIWFTSIGNAFGDAMMDMIE